MRRSLGTSALCALAAGLAVGVGVDAEDDPFAGGAPPDLVVLSSTDLRGETEPCGCASGPLGGLARRAGVIDSARVRNSRVVVVDAGEIAGSTPATAATRGLFLLEAAKSMGYDALTLGDGDAALGAELIRVIAADATLPLVSANLRDETRDRLLLAPFRVVDRDGVRVGITAVTAPARDGGQLAALGIAAGDPAEALRDVVPALRERSDVVVVLARMTLAQAYALTESQAGAIDAIVLGGSNVGRGVTGPEVGGALYVVAGDLGKAMGRARFRLGADRRPEFSAADEIVLGTDLPESEWMASLAAEFRANLGEILQDEAVRSARDLAGPDGGYYVGAARCGECHAREHAIWAASPHASAFRTLVDAGSDELPACVRCHVTGDGEPGGYVAGLPSSAALRDVQCEACHGKGSGHARDGSWGRSARGACRTCHDAENSPDFDPDSYWRMIEH
jgi:2',3'-cyclic-nucleotide 2'-phosphodiesterase (5'-nucleotidase family)